MLRALGLLLVTAVVRPAPIPFAFFLHIPRQFRSPVLRGVWKSGDCRWAQLFCCRCFAFLGGFVVFVLSSGAEEASPPVSIETRVTHDPSPSLRYRFLQELVLPGLLVEPTHSGAVVKRPDSFRYECGFQRCHEDVDGKSLAPCQMYTSLVAQVRLKANVHFLGCSLSRI